MGSDVISEAELQKKGVKYKKNEEGTTFYVEKTALDKLKDYSFRALGTPFTVVIDAVIMKVTGFAFGGSQLETWPSEHPAEEKKSQDRTENDVNAKSK